MQIVRISGTSSENIIYYTVFAILYCVSLNASLAANGKMFTEEMCFQSRGFLDFAFLVSLLCLGYK